LSKTLKDLKIDFTFSGLEQDLSIAVLYAAAHSNSA
jgi:hypothetical protein